MISTEKKCTEIAKLFSPYLDGRVSGAEMRALTRHVEECADCAREFTAMQRTQQLPRTIPRIGTAQLIDGAGEIEVLLHRQIVKKSKILRQHTNMPLELLSVANHIEAYHRRRSGTWRD